MADVAAVDDFGDTHGDTAGDLDTFFLLVSGYLVFFMQCGFCMLSAGSVRGKNAKNIILKNLLDACFGALGWYFLGYGFAFGKVGDNPAKDSANEFISHANFLLNEVDTSGYSFWFFQYAFAATAATIVSGAVAERTKFEAYLLYAFFLTAWVYPVVVHWVWSDDGWLSAFRSKADAFNDSGMIDFAGCGVVHMVGGFAGLAGAFAVGPRIGRYGADGKAREIPGHSAALALLGVFILWFGWYGFNPGSALAIVGSGKIAALCAVTTTLAAAAGTISTLLITVIVNLVSSGKIVWDVIGAGNGALGGLVSITASCSVVHPYSAVIIGMIGGLVYFLASNFMAHVIKVDDPLDAVAVHGFCGIWGLIAAAAFADEDLMRLSYGEFEFLNDDGSVVTEARPHGFFTGGDGKLLVSAVVGIAVIFGWVMVHMVPFFLLTRYLGLLRVAPEEEEEGLDVSHHGGSAYPTDQARTTKEEGSPSVRELASDVSDLKAQVERLVAKT